MTKQIARKLLPPRKREMASDFCTHLQPIWSSRGKPRSWLSTNATRKRASRAPSWRDRTLRQRWRTRMANLTKRSTTWSRICSTAMPKTLPQSMGRNRRHRRTWTGSSRRSARRGMSSQAVHAFCKKTIWFRSQHFLKLQSEIFKWRERSSLTFTKWQSRWSRMASSTVKI